jgi:butyrate kinase
MQELLLPTPTNLSTIQLPLSDLLHFIRVQQWVHKTLHTQLPLLHGLFVLVGSMDLQETTGSAQQAYSSVHAAAIAAAIPWRLRQISAVEVAPGVDPADATVVLVGGDRVRAGAVKQGLLAEVQDHEVGVV